MMKMKKNYHGVRPGSAYERTGRGKDSYGAVIYSEQRGGVRGTGLVS